MPESTADNFVSREDFDRVRLLGEELDRLTVDVGERSASVSNKASFLAVSSGVLITATTSQLWTNLIWFGIAALVLACVGLLCAAVALRPGRRHGLVAQRLTDTYMDSTVSSHVVEKIIAKTKSDSITLRETDLVARARWVLCGFGALVLSAACLSVVFATELFGG